MANVTRHYAAVQAEVLQRDGEICQYCGTGTARHYIFEHVVPEALGGHSEPYNLVIACQNCNTSKKQETWIPRNFAVLAGLNPTWGRHIRDRAAQNKPRRVPPPTKSYRLYRSLTKRFSLWARERDMTESEAAALALVYFMEHYDAE